MFEQKPIIDLLDSSVPTLSVEFFPPKSQDGVESLVDAASRIASRKPDFVSVTYGAGGSTRDLSASVSERMKNDIDLQVMPHLTCVGSTKEELATIVDGFYQDGLIKQLDSRILPIISNIIVTKPLSNKELSLHNFKTYSPIVNTRNLLYYYRKLPDNRILFGARGDTDGSDKSHKNISKIIERDFKNVFPEWGNIKIDFTWRGLVAFTSKLAPSIGKIKDENIFYSFGYHANGVSSAPWSGMQLSKIIYGSNFGNMNISKVYKGLPKKIPVSSLRKIYLKFVYFAYQIKDYFKL